MHCCTVVAVVRDEDRQQRGRGLKCSRSYLVCVVDYGDGDDDHDARGYFICGVIANLINHE